MAKAKSNDERDTLAKELRALIPRLNEEGLAFLIEQAQVHLYNMQVDELNSSIVKSQARQASKSSGKTAAKTSKAGGAETSGGFKEIKASDSGSSYYIVYKTEWIMFAKDEMIKLITIAKSEGTELDIKERLFNWLRRERTDLLNSAAIANKFDPKLKSLAGLLKKCKEKA
jgi:hypothetical protein